MEEGIIRLATALDSEDMIGYTRKFADDLEDGQECVREELLPWLSTIRKNWSGVLFLGMGGSAAGGDFISTIADRLGKKPVRTHRGYELPEWWDSSWLVVATSYSGNTEETLSVTEAAAADGTVVVISSGGVLAGMCELHENMYLISCPSGQPPRSAFGHLFSRQLALMVHAGILPHTLGSEALMRLRLAVGDCDILADPEGDICLLAAELIEAPISILGPSELLPALNRFKNQLNENSARFARIDSFPEMNHNEIVAWGGVGPDQDPQSGNQAVLLVNWDGMHRRVHQRMDWFVSHCPSERAWRIQGEGASLVEALLHLCITMDWLSIALALLHGKDPSAIDPISSLKQHLSEINQ